jgi:hypothetical protein
MSNRHLNILDLLTVLFVGLKLMGHIDWSWFLVWLPALLSYAGSLIFIVGAALWASVKDR